MKLLIQNFIYSGIQAVLQIINNTINLQSTGEGTASYQHWTVTTYIISQVALQNNQIVLVGYSTCSNTVAVTSGYSYKFGFGYGTRYCGTYYPGPLSPVAYVGIYLLNPNVPANLTAYYSVIYLPSDIT